MRWFSDRKTAHKLAMGFGICLALTAVIGYVASTRTQHLGSVAMNLTTDEMLIEMAGQVQSDLLKYHRAEISLILADEHAEMDEFAAEMDNYASEFKKDLAELERLVYTAKDTETLKTVQAKWDEFEPVSKQVIALARENKDAEAHRLSKKRGEVLVGHVESVIEGYTTHKKQQAVESKKQTQATIAVVHSTIVGLLTVAIVVGVLCAVFITRQIAGGLAQIAYASKQLSLGDTEQKITICSKDEVGQVANAFRELIGYQQEMAGVASTIADGDLTCSLTPKSEKDLLGYSVVEMIRRLRELVGEVARSAEAVAAASTQLSAAAEQTGAAANEIAKTVEDVAQAASQSAMTSGEMAQGCEQQARTATEAAEHMERLHSAAKVVKLGGERQQEAVEKASEGMVEASAAVDSMSATAKQMAASAVEAATVAETGGKAVAQTIESMGRIKAQVDSSSLKVTELGERGQEIGAIIDTINQIAEQTNLLALNAAIEAARAGEHGRGFAVVADEVRKLAERAASATKEIGALIGNVRTGVDEAVRSMAASGQEVTSGFAKSEEAGAALEQILKTVRSVADEVEGLSATALKMAKSVDMVSESMKTVRQTAEQNEAAVHEMTEGAEQVSTAIDTVASISQETSAGVEEMSAASQEVAASAESASAGVEEQTASIEEVNASANELNAMAIRLQKLVGQFKYEETPAHSNNPPKTLLKAA